MKLNFNIISYFKSLVKYFKNDNRSPYFVKIYDLYSTEDEGVLVKYHIINTRITNTISVHEFVNTPLIFGVHPYQLYLLGYDEGAYSEKLKSISAPTINSKSPRFKRRFLK